MNNIIITKSIYKSFAKESPMSLLKDLRFMTLLIVTFIFMIGAVQADDLDLKKAKNTVDNIRKADPPAVSTTTKKSVVGVKTSEFQPKKKALKITPPPPPPAN